MKTFMKTPELVLCFVLLTLSLLPVTAGQSLQTITNNPGTSTTYDLYMNCGGYMNGSCGILLSPEFPNNYPANCRCTWEISTSPDTYVVIYFPTVNLEIHPSCYWDFVSIHDGPPGSSMIAKICDPGSYTFYASSNKISVVFKSDEIVQTKGFQAIFYTQTFYSTGPSTTAPPYTNSPTTTTPPYIFNPTTTTPPYIYNPTTTVTNPTCGGPMTRYWGVFTSPFYPSSYAPNTLCKWEILVPQNYIVYITVYIASLESNPSCIFDYVEISEDNVGSNVLGKICEPGTYSYNTVNKMNIVFRSDGSIQGSGFEAQYYSYYNGGMPPISSTTPFPAMPSTTSSTVFRAMPSTTSSTVFHANYTNCGGNLTESSGEIKSPMYPQNYPANCWCIWKITAPPNKAVEINFNYVELEYHPQCMYDYVKVYNGNQELGNFCGNQTGVYNALSNSMRIEFRSDVSIERSGFMAMYKFVNP